MSRMSWRAAPGPERLVLLSAPGRDAVLTTAAVLLTAGIFAAVGEHGTLTSVQRLDDGWLRLMVSGRTPPLTAIAKVFNILGLVYVTLPARIAVAGLLALRRRWWQLAAFTAAVVMSEVLIGLLKGIYDRPRPPDSLVVTTGSSFPSGHAVAASVTRRGKAETSMNTSQTYHDEQTGSARDGPGPAREHPARLVPSSRYRHPGDVIRLIGADLILIVSLAVLAVAPSHGRRLR